MFRLGAYYELDVTCRGEPDPITGYLINITAIDRAVRAVAIPRIRDALRSAVAVDPAALLPQLAVAVQNAVDREVIATQWRLTPTFSLTVRSDDMTHVILRQQFEFSAAHRLHCRELSDGENRDTFGKCNNPNGHGHTYNYEVTVKGPVPRSGMIIDLNVLRSLMHEEIFVHVDHKHLDLDVEFLAGRISTAENLAVAFWERLAPRIDDHPGCRLHRLRVYEGPDSFVDYFGPGS